MKLISDHYTIYVNNNNVIMACNQTRMPHSLSNLCIIFNDLAFYAKTKAMGYDEQAQALQEVVLSGDIQRLNKITGQNFAQG